MYNATRFAQKPLPQPAYNFSEIEKPPRDLKDCQLQYVNDRDHFHAAMAEMLLLCKEAVRRRPCARTGTSKPLSLEYLADRMDVDDPLWGYLIRNKEGMLLGFVTVTTFTNYQQTFRWDSRNSQAFSYDGEEDEEERLLGVRQWDKDGSLADGMQETVRCGDIWNEGIVWPRIAEISLLGALGCGRALISLVIEELERMKPTSTHNYDYVVLQATENSKPFYESMGFVRVGAVTKEEVKAQDRRSSMTSQTSSSSSSCIEAEVLPPDSPEKADTIATKYEIISSPNFTYTTKKKGETPNDVAKKFGVDVWDIIFLNKDIYKEICPTARLLEGTLLHVPKVDERKKRSSPTEQTSPTYYFAKENETPRGIAKMFGVDCLKLVEANKGRLEGLLSNSRLMAGTRLKVSNFDNDDDEYNAYAHWGFPDDEFEDQEPSYMMALKLDRKKGNQAVKRRPFLESLATTITPYTPTPLVLPTSPVRSSNTPARPSVVTPKPPDTDANAPKPPKRPTSAYLLFCTHKRAILGGTLEGKSGAETSKVLGKLWNSLPPCKRNRYEVAAQHDRKRYQREKEQYDAEFAKYQESRPEAQKKAPAPASRGGSASTSLYNKVVRLRPEAITEGSDYEYWYVLTFIPDLKWCHLAPMRKAGTFGEDRPRAKGRTKWILVDEKLGKEVDISSSFCIPIKSRSMRRTADADKEEWDIIDDGSDPFEIDRKTPRTMSTKSSYDSDTSYSERPTPGPPHSPQISRMKSFCSGSDFIEAKMPGKRGVLRVIVKVGGKPYKNGKGIQSGRLTASTLETASALQISHRKRRNSEMSHHNASENSVSSLGPAERKRPRRSAAPDFPLVDSSNTPTCTPIRKKDSLRRSVAPKFLGESPASATKGSRIRKRVSPRREPHRGKSPGRKVNASEMLMLSTPTIAQETKQSMVAAASVSSRTRSGQSTSTGRPKRKATVVSSPPSGKRRRLLKLN